MRRMSEIEQRARQSLGDDVVDAVRRLAQDGPPLSQAQLDLIGRAFGPAARAARDAEVAAAAA